MDTKTNQPTSYTDPRGRLVRPLGDHFHGSQGCDGSGMEGEFIYDGHDGQGRLLHSCDRCGFLTDGFSKRARK
ncbi:MAG: hypothetical protein HQM04_15555 [Magnetococcales bacterium]|nr:hypothetical protein [Magnetococcales bacterium]